MRNAISNRLAAFVVGATLVSPLQGANASERRTESPRPITSAAHCYLAGRYVPREQAQRVSDWCTPTEAMEARRSAREIAFSSYYAGVADRYLGEAAGSDVAVASRHFTSADALLQRSIALSPTSRAAMLELAWVRYREHRYREAVTQIDEVLRLETNPESTLHAAAHYLRGRVLQEMAQPVAALTEFSNFVSDNLDDHPDAADARLRQIQIASEQGEAAIEEVGRENAQRAIDLFTLAHDAAAAGSWRFSWPITYGTEKQLYAADIYNNVGLARLRMASALSPAGPDNFICAPDSAPAEWLEQARNAFRQAISIGANHAAAHKNLACVELALGHTDAAIAAATAATQAQPSADAYIMLGRAEASVSPATEQSLAASAAAFENAVLFATPGRNRARVLVDVADVYLRLARAKPVDASANAARAIASLRQAVAQDTSFALAHVNLGEQLFLQGVKPLDAPLDSLLEEAQQNFLRAEELSNQRDTAHGLGDPQADAETRARALYYLSRLSVEWHSQLNERRAISYADQALELFANWPHREQACRARIRFGRVQPTDGSSGYCVLSGPLAPSAQAHLLQGMYYLRQAQLLRGGAQHRALENAYRTFGEGLSAQMAPDEESSLRALLLQGQATAQYCIGFATIGHDLMASAEAQYPDEAGEAHRLFDSYRVFTCNGSLHQH